MSEANVLGISAIFVTHMDVGNAETRQERARPLFLLPHLRYSEVP